MKNFIGLISEVLNIFEDVVNRRVDIQEDIK